MAEVLTELVAKITTDAAGLKSGLSEGEKATEASSKRMSESLQKVGMAMAASGAAITAALGIMGKAAIDEEINIKRLATTMGNAGTAYDDVKDSLEAVISATQRKTGVADNEQRDILNRLILVTNDYDKALELLPTVLNLAAAGEMDATTAATYLGKAFLELENGAESVSVRFGQASLKFKDMEDIQNRVAGAAENLANPLDVLKASIGDVAESIGMNLIPMIKGAVDWIVDIAIKIQDWIKENPVLAKTLTIVAAALGVVLTVVGGLILIMPAVISGVAAFGVVFHAALGPIGLISLAITALIAIGIALWKNWDKVADFFKGLWINMKIIFAEGVKFIVNTVLMPFLEFYGKMFGFITQGIGKLVGVFNKELGASIEGVGEKLKNARGELTEWADNLAEGARVEKSIRDTEKAIVETEVALKGTEEALNNTAVAQESSTKTTQQATEAWDYYNAAIVTQREELQKQQQELINQRDALLEIKDSLEKTRTEWEYSRSDAGRLGVTLRDVNYYLLDQGKTVDELAVVFRDLGDDATDVNKVMEAFGITAQEVKGILDEQKASVDALGDAYVTANERAVINPQIRDTGETGEMVRWPGLEGVDAGRMTKTIQDALANPDIPKLPGGAINWAAIGATPGMSPEDALGLIGYEKGGFVEHTGPAFLHAGETVIPANESTGGLTVNFTQPVFFDREDTMNRFVQMIRNGIQRQDRLRFGGAYGG